MKGSRKGRVVAMAAVACYGLLGLCAPSPGDESSASTEPLDKAAGDVPGQEHQSDGKHEDILDRVFSPLDEAVSDINRGLNKGEDSASDESGE